MPTILKLARKHRLRVRLDCSYTPMVTHHRSRAEVMRWLAIYGCAGGDLLVGAKASGMLTACSFAPPVERRVDGIGDYWDEDGAFGPFRRWREAAAEPCRSCDYLALCRGGCRVVTMHVLGDPSAPDPECPRVIDWRAANGVTTPKRLPVIGSTKFRARIESIKGGGHYVVVPANVAEKAKLKYGARVRGTVAGAPYRSSLMKYSGTFHLGVHKATMKAADVEAGAMVAIELELDDQPLPGDTLPPELAAVFARNAKAKAAWDKLAPSHRREHVKAIDEAKRPETRKARIERTLQMLE